MSGGGTGDCPRSNLTARPTLRAAIGPAMPGQLNDWERDQWQGLGLLPVNPGAPLVRPWGAPPDWVTVIEDGYIHGARLGHYARHVPHRAPEDPQAAVIHSGRQACLLVDAPPGTGKTHVLVERLRRLRRVGDIANINANSLVLSFSRTAVVELRNRLAAAFPGPPGARPEVRTVDSLVALLMRLGDPAYQQPNHDRRKEDFLRLMDSQDAGLQARRDMILQHGLARFDFLFIDEFQDVIGINAQVLLRVVGGAIESRRRFFPDTPPVPAILVLGDHRQYINFWQFEGIPPQYRHLDPDAFIGELRELLGQNSVALTEVNFHRNYRASQALQALMSDIREILDDALAGEDSPARCQQRLVDRLNGAVGISIQGLPDLRGELAAGGAAFLARSNSEVLRMASFLHGDADMRRKFCMVTSPGRFGYPGWLGQLLRAAVAGNLGNIGDERKVAMAHGQAGFNRQHGLLGARLPNPAEASEWINSAAISLGLAGGGGHGGALSPNDLIEAMRMAKDEAPEIRLLNRGEAAWISTVHQSKGRQFDRVLLDPGLLVVPAHGNDDQDLEALRISYVAATRAKNSIGKVAPNLMRGFGTDWWAVQIHADDDQGPLFGFEAWERWYAGNEPRWEEMCDHLWDLFADCTPAAVRQDQQGNWLIDLGVNLAIGIPAEAARTLRLNGGPFRCLIMDLRCRISATSRVFFMPVMSSRLEPLN